MDYEVIELSDKSKNLTEKMYTKIKEDDFIFTSYEGQELPRRQMDAGWKDLMEKTGFANYKERKLQYYSLRHYAISLRLRNPDETIWSVANYAGTRSEFIEQGGAFG